MEKYMRKYNAKREFLSITEEDIFNRFRKLVKPFAKNKNYMLFKGDLPVALTAHIDSVFTRKIMRKKLVGADDRAGVYAIYKILLALKAKGKPMPSVILCNYEELGCEGSSKLVETYPKPPEDFPVNWIIALDRRGKKDAVFYDTENQKFKAMILNYGFKFANGSFSDISVISPEWDVASVNLSIGFENEHTLKETWNMNWTQRTISRVLRIMLSDHVNTKFAWEGTKDWYSSYSYQGYGKNYKWNDWESEYKADTYLDPDRTHIEREFIEQDRHLRAIRTNRDYDWNDPDIRTQSESDEWTKAVRKIIEADKLKQKHRQYLRSVL
jgi:hypothetical protein